MVLFFMSNFDVYSDINLAYDYIAGATYFYILLNETHYPDITRLNCTVSYDTVLYDEFSGFYGVNCFVKEPILGYITLSVVFAPGHSALYDAKRYIF